MKVPIINIDYRKNATLRVNFNNFSRGSDVQDTVLGIKERVYLTRVKLFFGNSAKNLISVIIGGTFISLILHSAGVPLNSIFLWFFLLILFALVTGYIENRYKKTQLSIDNAAKWVYLRSFSGAMIALMYGLTPFLFSQYIGIQEEMFLFIALSTMVSIAIVGYSIMPYYFILLSLLTVTPIMFYFFFFGTDTLHLILAATAFMWQVLVLSKAWLVSQSAINAIYLNEKLQDEIKNHEATKEKLQELATHDSLTALPNRLLMMENLTLMIALAKRNKQKIIVMFLNLDGFKEINDIHGHEVGDFVLKEVALRLKSLTRSSDTLARIGGDEFVLAFMRSDNIEILAQRIIDTLSLAIVLLDSSEVSIGVSIGISILEDDAQTPQELIRIADDRMYISKANGKNRYTFSS